MASGSLYRRIGGTAAFSAVAAAMVLAQGGSAVAAPASITATKAPATAVSPASHVAGHAVGGSAAHLGGKVAHVTFTPKTKPGQAKPNTSFGCTVAYPYVVDTFMTGEITWTATVTCNINLRMQGTTVFFSWGSANGYAWGNSYDNFSTQNTSSGEVWGMFSGEWAVNDNVLLFAPTGYTTAPGAGCAWNDDAHTQVMCSETTGPFDATPPPVF